MNRILFIRDLIESYASAGGTTYYNKDRDLFIKNSDLGGDKINVDQGLIQFLENRLGELDKIKIGVDRAQGAVTLSPDNSMSFQTSIIEGLFIHWGVV